MGSSLHRQDRRKLLFPARAALAATHVLATATFGLLSRLAVGTDVVTTI